MSAVPQAKPIKKKPVAALKVEIASLSDLTPHPKNYRAHPPDQIYQLVQSLQQHGFYRNVVTAKDGTILAGHGIVEAARTAGLTEIPIMRLNVGPDHVNAIKVMIGDNELEHLAEQNDRLLTELLKFIKDDNAEGLVGTGYDEMMLANLLLVTRPESEIKDMNEAAHWVGLPDYDIGENKIQLVVTFPDEAARDRFEQETGVQIGEKRNKTWSTRWPWIDREDKASIQFQTAKK
jgi:hypothetical protein